MPMKSFIVGAKITSPTREHNHTRHRPAVATATVPDAADVAIATLAGGGNAFDAVVAACLVETVWMPMKCGLAGDLVALVREPNGRIETLLSIGPGGARYSPNAGLTVTGPRSIGIPGAPDGYAALAARGRLALGDLAAPAIERAQNGVAWLPLPVKLAAEAEDKIRAYNRDNSFLPQGKLPEEGAPLRLPGLARALATFVELGPELFWHDLGAVLAARIDEAGGLLDASDLRMRPATWQAPIRLTLDQLSIAATPPPTHGARLLGALKSVLEADDEPVSAIRKATDRTSEWSDGGTSVVAAGDHEGRGVVVVHSNSFPNFGSCVVLEDYDLVLNNRPGRGFDLNAEKDHPNAPAPGRVPVTTLHAWQLDFDGKSLLGATSGGANQAPWNLQTILDLIGGKAAEDVVVAPRWSFDKIGDLLVETGHAEAGLGGHQIPSLSQRSAEQILARHDGQWQACADPRIGAVARSIEDTTP